ncbi:MAG: dihydroneopterin aldolase [Acidimicrobiia bacterium]
MTDRIDITGIEVAARHGVLESEKTDPQTFLIDVTLFTDHRPAAESDDVADTIDYGSIAVAVRDLVTEESHDLIERLASNLVSMLLRDARVSRAVVTVHKPQAPIPLSFRDVSVTVDRSR